MGEHKVNFENKWMKIGEKDIKFMTIKEQYKGTEYNNNCYTRSKKFSVKIKCK